MYQSVVEGREGIVARVVADSVHADTGQRITTFELEYQRMIHSEIMTHRCLVGETELYFDLPSGGPNSELRLYKMSIKDFHDKWCNGSKIRKPPRYVERDTSGITPDKIYSAKELANMVGFKTPTSVRKFCRSGEIIVQNPNKKRSEDHLIKGQDFIDWVLSPPKSYKQNSQNRLKKMRVRAFDEATGEVIHTNITDIWRVGVKPTYKLVAGDYSIIGTEDHPILTDRGWVDLGELTEDDCVAVVSSKQKDKKDQTRLKKVDGVWRNRWQDVMRNTLTKSQDGYCAHCDEKTNLEIHHIQPVHKRPDLCFDENNVVAICKKCHKKEHETQGWQEGNPLCASYVKVGSVKSTGRDEVVYDISVSDKNHNFVANGLIVHNCFSRNAMSSRAVPITKMIEQVRNNPARPIEWGLNQRGMQAGEVHENAEHCENMWVYAAKQAADSAELLMELGLHKQIVNRVLEPFQMMKTVVTATEFNNYFHLRCHSDAQPEIHELANCMLQARNESTPIELKAGEWHVPYVITEREDDGDISYKINTDPEFGETQFLSIEEARQVSASCCAQVSFRLNDNSLDKALMIYDKLVNSKPVHASPFEHQATPTDYPYTQDISELRGIEGATHIDVGDNMWSGNFKHWIQFRQLIPENTVY